MDNFKRGRFEWKMLELPDGITTSNGNWYHITADGIEEYVPGLLDKYPLERVIKEADAWVKSSDGLSLMLFFLLAYATVNPFWAAVISVVFYLLWFYNTSVFISVTATPLAKLLNKDGFVYTVSAVLLLGISLNEVAAFDMWVSFSAVWYGLALVFLFKVGLLRMLIQWLRKKMAGLPEISKEDRILNMLLIRYGMREGILTGEVEEMEKELIRIKNYHKTRKKK